jgi:hypothetical protein
MNPLPSAKSAPICARKRALKLGTNETLDWEAISEGPKSLLKQQQTTAATLILKQNVSSKVSFIIDGLFGHLLLLLLRDLR